MGTPQDLTLLQRHGVALEAMWCGPASRAQLQLVLRTTFALQSLQGSSAPGRNC